MDTSRYKRRGTQTNQTNIARPASYTNNVIGGSPRYSAPVPRPVSPRQLTPMRPVQPPTVTPVAVVQAVPLMPAPLPIVPPVPVAVTPEAASKPRLPAIDMDLPGDDSPQRLMAALTNPKWQHARKLAFRSSAIALVLMITLGGLLISQSYLKAHKVFRGSTGTAAALKTNVKPELLKGEGDGRVNILLLGKGGGTHDAPDLTDTIMLVSIDPINNKATMISIPRDLWVTIPNGGAMKLNAAWQTGVYKYLGKQTSNTTDAQAIQAGFKSVDQTIENAVGMNINYNMIVDFQAFQQAVDTVNGVDVNVPADLVDPTMAWENNNDPVLAHVGQQTFDGKHALIYARSRETTSDFARSQRQRAIMLAIKSKVETLGTLSNPLKISGLLNAFGDNVSTDLSLNNASRLYSILKKIGDTNITSIGLGDEQNQILTTGNLNGQSIVLPKAGLFNFADVQSFLRKQVPDPYIVRENAKVLVLNGTTVPGVASTTGDELRSYGYNVTGTANTPNSGWSQTTLVDLTHKHRYTKNYLEKHFKVSAVNTLGDNTIPTNGADFVIIIGSDEVTPTSTTTAAQAH